MPLRILYVTQNRPWPERSGRTKRDRTILRCLARHGSVELVVLERVDSEPDAEVLSSLVSWQSAGLGGRSRSLGETFRWVIKRDRPSTMSGRSIDQWPNRVELDSPYDLLWIGGNTAALGAESIDAAHRIVDLDDLEFEKVRQRIGLISVGCLAAQKQRLHLGLLARDWERFQRRVARSSDRVALCSSEDVAAFGEPNTFVLPNTVPKPDSPAGDRFDPDEPATLLFVGLNSYGPNADGLRWFITDVLPLVRSARPDVRLRVVGRDTSPKWGEFDGVDVIGEVDDLTTELSKATALVAPIRFGGGTRVKIVEAFSHRVPVVATELGAFGLRATFGEQLLGGDTPQEFADACLALLDDAALRSRLVDAAEQLYVETLESSVVEKKVAAELERLFGNATEVVQ